MNLSRCIRLLLLFPFVFFSCKTRINRAEEKRVTAEADSTRICDSIYNAIKAAENFRREDSIRYANSVPVQNEESPIDSLHLEYFNTFNRLFDLSRSKECGDVRREKGVNSFLLNDATAINELLGARLPLHDLNVDHPYYECINASGTEALRLVFHEGGVYNEFDEMEIRLSDTTSPDQQLPDLHFISSEGIQLGMNRNDVLSKTGNCFSASGTAGNDSIVFTRKDGELFFRYFVFHDNLLVYYRFGNIYP